MSTLPIDAASSDIRSSASSAWHESIAVVGLGCRLPGGIESPTEAWEAFSTGREYFLPFPKSRLDGACSKAWGSYKTEDFVDGACLLDDVRLFDPALFGISPREARNIDPLQRLLLLTTWGALEDACIPPRSLRGQKVGVFVGASSGDYGHLIRSDEAAPFADIYSGTGAHPSMAAGRIAHCFGLCGPAVALDTACSSSLVAVHAACQSLLLGECDLAIVAGAQLLLDPKSVFLRGMLKALAPDGRCKPFSDRANGFGMGEGVIVAVLKRQQDAFKDSDRIDATIRGTSVGHNGGGAGLTVPSLDAQVRVIKQALEAANIKPGSVDYVEAHGTGTALGDPIEVGALNEAYGDRSRPLFIGSAKGNFGHLEAASGLLSLLKVTLSLHAGVIPSSLHGTPLNSEISWPDLPIQLATDRRTWCAAQGRRRAGISSFGMSGTNCHLLIEEGPSTERDDIVAPGPHLIVLSADSRDALAQLAAAYWDFLAETPLPLDALSCALGRGRSHLSIRAAFVAHDPDELMSALASLAWSRSQSHIHLSEDRLPKRPEIPTVELSINAADCERTRNTISALRKRLAELRIVTPTQHYSDVSDQTASRLDESSPIIRVAGQAIPVPHQLVSDVACEYNTLARLYIAGADLNWSACISGGVHKPRLPTYPFSLSPFWFDLPQNKLA